MEKLKLRISSCSLSLLRFHNDILASCFFIPLKPIPKIRQFKNLINFNSHVFTSLRFRVLHRHTIFQTRIVLALNNPSPYLSSHFLKFEERSMLTIVSNDTNALNADNTYTCSNPVNPYFSGTYTIHYLLR